MSLFRNILFVLATTSTLGAMSDAIASDRNDATAVLPQLTEAERKWLEEHTVIRVGADPDFPPFEAIDEDGRHWGMAADYLAILEEKLGIHFEIVHLESWAEVLEQAKDREVDMLSAAAKTPQRSEYLDFTTAHMRLPGVIIATTGGYDDVTLESLAGKRVAVVEGYAWQDMLVNDHPEIDVVLAPDTATGLQMTSFGIVDAMVGDLATTTYYIREEGLANLRVAGRPDFRFNLSIATRKDWPELNSILEKALLAISDEQRREIQDRWIVLQQKALWRKPVFWYWTAGGGITVLLMFGAVLTWNRVLKRVVSQKTSELKGELEWRKEAEDELRQHRDHLNDLVNERTAELSKANERMRNDLEAASKVQQALLPKIPPDVPGTNFVWHYRPCDELAGDILNVFQLDNDHIGFYVADVSGHGVAASLLSVAISRVMTPDASHASILARPNGNSHEIELTSPAEVAHQLNKQFPMEEFGDKYFTILYGIFNHKTLELRYVSAGHPPIVRSSSGEESEILSSKGIPIGWYEDSEYEETICQLKRGDRLCFYSDGIPEAMNADLEQFGTKRLIRAISGGHSDSLDKNINDIAWRVEQWCGQSGPKDDVSILAMEIS